MITKIQSFTDVITNSSSSVFVMREEDAEYYSGTVPDGCFGMSPITIDWIRQCPEEAEMICDLLDVDMETVTTWHEYKNSWGGYWETPHQEVWDSFVELHKEKIEEVFEGLWWVDIEDHFEDALEVTREAYGDSVWSESRH